MAKLIIYEDFEDEETIIEDFDLAAQRILIGSGPDNELVLDAVDVAPAHASLELRNQHWVIQDLGSATGTEVNGQSVDGPHHLQHNDLIELGGVRIRFHTESEVEELEPSATPGKEESPEVHIRGRVWFAAIAGGTLAIIFLIILLLVIADYLGLLRIADLLPFG